MSGLSTTKQFHRVPKLPFKHYKPHNFNHPVHRISFFQPQDLDETDLGGRVSWQTSDDRLVQNYVAWQHGSILVNGA